MILFAIVINLTCLVKHSRRPISDRLFYRPPIGLPAKYNLTLQRQIALGIDVILLAPLIKRLLLFPIQSVDITNFEPFATQYPEALTFFRLLYGIQMDAGFNGVHNLGSRRTIRFLLQLVLPYELADHRRAYCAGDAIGSRGGWLKARKSLGVVGNFAEQITYVTCDGGLTTQRR